MEEEKKTNKERESLESLPMSEGQVEEKFQEMKD
jgi:hypothetical protein